MPSSAQSAPRCTIAAGIAACNNAVMLRDVEPAIVQHFVRRYFALIINPESHQLFYRDWMTIIQQALSCHGGVRYSVLSNAASNIFFRDGSASMQDLALKYYSRSMSSTREVVAVVKDTPEHLRTTLTSIIFLYLHGCMGLGTFNDIPAHLNAAIFIVDSQWFDTHDRPILPGPFDRLVVESVMYQIFVVTVDLWSSDGSTQSHFDPDFWERCTRFLTATTPFPEQLNTRNSPVLGVDVDMFRLMISIRKHWSMRHVRHAAAFELRTEELRGWEKYAHLLGNEGEICEGTSTRMLRSITDDATCLYMLCASMLIDQLLRHAGKEQAAVGGQIQEESWQIPIIMAILCRRRQDANWLGCYIGNWPVYTAGIFANSSREVEVINHEMNERWESMRLYQVRRYWDDLKMIWASKGIDP